MGRQPKDVAVFVENGSDFSSGFHPPGLAPAMDERPPYDVKGGREGMAFYTCRIILQNLEFGIWNLEYGIWNMEAGSGK